jgi:hypothetical protein
MRHVTVFNLAAWRGRQPDPLLHVQTCIVDLSACTRRTAKKTQGGAADFSDEKVPKFAYF